MKLKFHIGDMHMRTADILILGISFILSSTILGTFFYQARSERETIAVIGKATKPYKADIVKWRVTLTRSVGLLELKTGYHQLQKDSEIITNSLLSNGIDSSQITLQPINSNINYDRNGLQSGYKLQQSFFLISKDLDAIEKLALVPNFIIDKGIILESSSLEYYFSSLPHIKRELLIEATKDAKSRADSIAKVANRKINKMIFANTGIFQINEPFSTDVQYYGVYNTSTRNKDVSITLNATYTLK